MDATEMIFTADGRRLDVLLSELSGLTRSRVAALMEEGRVTVDGVTVTKAGLKAKAGQQVVLTIQVPHAEAGDLDGLLGELTGGAARPLPGSERPAWVDAEQGDERSG